MEVEGEGGGRVAAPPPSPLKLLFNSVIVTAAAAAGGERGEAESNLSPDCQLTTELNRLSRDSRRYCSVSARDTVKNQSFFPCLPVNLDYVIWSI